MCASALQAGSRLVGPITNIAQVRSQGLQRMLPQVGARPGGARTHRPAAALPTLPFLKTGASASTPASPLERFHRQNSGAQAGRPRELSGLFEFLRASALPRPLLEWT